MACLYSVNTARRDIGRKEYKDLYRFLRVTSRKAEKAVQRSMEDMMLHGTCALFVPREGSAQHVPLKDIMSIKH